MTTPMCQPEMTNEDEIADDLADLLVIKLQECGFSTEDERTWTRDNVSVAIYSDCSTAVTVGDYDWVIQFDRLAARRMILETVRAGLAGEQVIAAYVLKLDIDAGVVRSISGAQSGADEHWGGPRRLSA